jgi:membrane associated rhomboid family serine protease
MRSQPVRPLHAVVVMAVLLAGLWVLEGLDQLSGNALDTEIFTAPLLHAGWDHLAGNSVPFFLLGLLVLLGGLARWVVSTLVSVVSSGLTAWLLTPAGTIVLGASGLIFGWLTYLLVRGVWSRRPGQVALAVVILLVYGGLLWGVLPGAAGVSWQAHLGGAVGGVLAAWLLHRRDAGRPRVDEPATLYR